MKDKKLTLIEHLEELRRRLLIALLAITIGTTLCFIYWQEFIRKIIMAPLDSLIKNLYILSVTEGFIVQLKTAFIGGLIIASPVVLWQIVAFLMPALYKKERKIFLAVFISSLLLFILGIVFAYKFVLGVGLRYLLVNFSVGLTPMISAAKYISFVINFLFPFGIVFEIPVVTAILTKSGLITPEYLKTKWRYIILIIFIIAAILTPTTDILSQVLLAIPMAALYLISIAVSVLIYKTKKKS
jgi:sec-independent protein translocase protein TatC